MNRKLKPDSSRQGQAQEFGLWFIDFGLILWTKDDSGLPTRPLTITKTLNKFL